MPIAFILFPLLYLISHTNLESIGSLLRDGTFQSSLGTSVFAALCTTTFALIFGLPTAFFLSISRIPGKRWFEAILLLPLVMPPLVGGIAELSVYGPATPLGSWFVARGTPLTDSFLGVVLAQSFVTSPFLILAARAGFDDVPNELIETTKLLGGGLWTQFWSVCVPLSKSAIYIGVLLTFARSIGEFGATLLMAYHPYTIPVDIWVSFSGGGLNPIVPMAVVLLVVSFVIVLVTSLRTSLRRA